MTVSTDIRTNLDTIRAWIDGMNAGDLSFVDGVVGEEIVDHHLPPGIPAGREGMRLWCALLRDTLQIHIEIEDAVVEGDRVTLRATVSGTHVGEFGGMPATNRHFSASMMSIERLKDGQVVERWENVDMMTVMQQLTS